jgi:hypothetical protein
MTKPFSIVAIFVFLSGCVSKPYEYGPDPKGGGTEFAPSMKQQIIVGEPSAFLDASDWIWPGSWIAKLVLWNKNIDSHQISPDTIDEIETFVEKNDLGDVQILVNTYRPGVQWRRLFKNREVGGFWRYTLGILSTSIYTVLPGRFFGGDHYNPYTNTISLYSDDAAIALHEAGHAKDFNGRKYKGLHAALYAIPGAPLYYEAVASTDTISYLHHECRYDDQKHAYRVLHPAYGTYVGGTFAAQSGLGILGAIPGHITGGVTALFVDDKDEPCTISDNNKSGYNESMNTEKQNPAESGVQETSKETLTEN